MIERLHLENFQCWEDVVLNFVPGVNVIAGPSDTGKSAIKRALVDWLICNDLSGDGFKTQGKDFVRTTCTVDGVDVQRVRSAKNNSYLIDKKELKGFGIRVPDEIQKLFNMSEINWHNQLGEPFLLGQKPRGIALELNKMVNLDIIDSSLRCIGRTLWGEQSELKKVEKDISALEQELDDLKWVEEEEKQVAKVIKVWNSIQEINQDFNDITAAIQDLKYYDLKIEAVQPLVNAGPRVQNLKKQLQEVLGTGKELAELQEAISKLERIDMQIAKAEQKVKTAETRYQKEMPDVCPLCKQPIKKKK